MKLQDENAYVAKNTLNGIIEYLQKNALFFQTEVDYVMEKQLWLIRRYGKGSILPISEDEGKKKALCDSLVKNELTSAIREAICEEINGACRVSAIVTIFAQGIHKMIKMYSARDSEMVSLLVFSQSVLRVLDEIYYRYDYCRMKLQSSMWEQWDKQLTKVLPGTYNEFDIIVSLGDYEWYKKKYPIISCSYVNERFLEFYRKDRRVGWYFRPDVRDVLGMCYFDASSLVDKGEDFITRYSNVLKNKPSVDEFCWLAGTHPDFQCCLTMQQMSMREEYNEIILKGSKKPDGIFVFKGYFDECDAEKENFLLKKSEELKIPILILNEQTKQMECIYPKSLLPK